jgi:hypothetical protein
MSGTRSYWILSAVLTCAAGLFPAGAAVAQAPPEAETNLLDQARRMNKVAAQKIEAEIRQALRDAQRLAQTSCVKAIERLKYALAQLEADTVLSEERRDSLKRMLKDRIRVTEQDAVAASKQREKQPPAKRSTDENRGELEKIRSGLKNVKELEKDNKTDEASRKANELANRFTDNPAAQASGRTTSAAEQVMNARKLQKDRERRLAAGFQDIDASASPPSGDLEFPKNWKEKTKGRTNTIELSAKEKSILQALNTTISVNLRNSKLEDVIEYLQTYTNQAILLDKESLKEVEASYDTPVTLSVKGVAVRTVLRKILADLGLTYVIKDEAIQVTTAQRAKEMMVVRRYYVGDILANMSTLGVPSGWPGPLARLAPGPVLPLISPLFPGTPVVINPPPQAAPVLNQQLQAADMTQNAKMLIDLIQTSVDSHSWQANGGNGTIVFNAPSMSLIIKQSAEVHAMLGNGGLLK